MAEQSNIQTLINSWNHELASTEEESKDFCLRQCKIAETMLNTEPLKADGIAAALIHFAQHNIGDHDSPDYSPSDDDNPQEETCQPTFGFCLVPGLIPPLDCITNESQCALEPMAP